MSLPEFRAWHEYLGVKRLRERNARNRAEWKQQIAEAKAKEQPTERLR